MDQINAIIAELQAVEKTSLDGVVGAIDKAVADLQAFAIPPVDAVASIVVTTQAGVATEFVPKA